MYKNDGLNFLKITMYMHIIPYKNVEKEKYTSHTIACLMVFKHAFCHTRVEKLLKGPDL